MVELIPEVEGKTITKETAVIILGERQSGSQLKSWKREELHFAGISEVELT